MQIWAWEKDSYQEGGGWGGQHGRRAKTSCGGCALLATAPLHLAVEAPASLLLPPPALLGPLGLVFRLNPMGPPGPTQVLGEARYEQGPLRSSAGSVLDPT